MGKIRLSVIIPHYNSVKLLYKLIESIPRRDGVEIIVIDDCSTQEAEKVEAIATIRPEQIRLFYNESGKNSAGACRNIGLEHANGDWLLFADADDFFMPNFYENIKIYLDSDYDIVYFMPCSLDLNTDRSSTRHELFEKLIKQYLNNSSEENLIRLKYYWESPWSKLIRRELIEGQHVRFDCTRVANDTMFSTRVAYAAQKIEVSSMVIYCVTKGEGSLTTLKNKNNYYTRLDVFLRKYKFLKQHLSRNEWKMLDLLGGHYIKLARVYGLEYMEIFKIYGIFLKNGVRPYISRKWTIKKIIIKMKRKI